MAMHLTTAAAPLLLQAFVKAEDKQQAGSKEDQSVAAAPAADKGTVQPQQEAADGATNQQQAGAQPMDTDCSSPAPPAQQPTPSLSPEQLASAQRYSARVILYSGASPQQLHAPTSPAHSLLHRKLQFLIGRRGRSEFLAPGAAWQPCDGGHPETDPLALLRTAARGLREATGVEAPLSATWFRFAEFRYMRGAGGREGSGAVEHVVLFLVDAACVAQADDEAEVQLAQARRAAGGHVWVCFAVSSSLSRLPAMLPCKYGSAVVRCEQLNLQIGMQAGQDACWAGCFICVCACLNQRLPQHRPSSLGHTLSPSCCLPGCRRGGQGQGGTGGSREGAGGGTGGTPGGAGLCTGCAAGRRLRPLLLLLAAARRPDPVSPLPDSGPASGGPQRTGP